MTDSSRLVKNSDHVANIRKRGFGNLLGSLSVSSPRHHPATPSSLSSRLAKISWSRSSTDCSADQNPRPEASSNRPTSVRRVGIERAQPVEHLFVERECRCDLIVDPAVDPVSGRGPTKRVRYVMFDLSHPAEPVAKHAFKPFWIERLCSRLEPHSLFKRSDSTARRKRIRQIDARP